MLRKRLYILMFLLIITSSLYACQDQGNTTEETTTPTTTETITYDLPYDVYFDFEIDYTKDQNDLTQALTELRDYFAPYGRQELYKSVDEHVASNITEGEPIYIDDLEYFEAFDTYFSKDALLYNDLMYMISILEHPSIELGVLQQYNVDYYWYDYGCVLNGCDLSKNGDVEVMVLLGDHQIYADIWLFSEDNELEKRSTYRIVYDEQGIVELDKYEFNSLLDEYLDKNEFNLIDYTRGEGGMMMTTTDSAVGISDYQLLIFEADDSYAAYGYDSRNNRLFMTKINMEDEYFFWTIYDEDSDFRNILIYEDNVFQVGYRYYYDYSYEGFLSGNNFIEYNLKDINNASYLEDNHLYYYDAQDELMSMSYPNLGLSHYFEPGFSPGIRYQIDSEISKSLYEHPLEVLEYDHLPYEEFISIWNSLENVWDEFYLEDSQLNILMMDIDLEQLSLGILPDLTYHSFNVFIDDIDRSYPEVIYRD